MTLIYHFCVLFVPCLLRLLKANRRPYAGLAAVFGDGCAMVAMINSVVMLDSAHHDYCHRPPSGGGMLSPRAGDSARPMSHTNTSPGFDFQSMLSLGRNNHHHDMRSHRSVCKSLDLIFGVGGLVMCVLPDTQPRTESVSLTLFYSACRTSPPPSSQPGS